MNVCAIIPARGGSKGIHKKNLVKVCGKPLIEWSIEHAIRAKRVNSVWITSDSDEILSIAKSAGANTIKRPFDISGDFATTESAWIHAIEEIERSEAIDLVVGMQATSPVRESIDLDNAITKFFVEKYDSMFSASEIDDFFIWHKINKNFRSFNYDYKNRKRRQDISKQYLETGSFYLFTPNLIREHNNRLAGKIGIAVTEFWKSFEIDTMEDVKFCETIIKNYILQ